MSQHKPKFIFSIFWTLFQQFGVQIINFIVQLIIARQLGPGAFGTIAMLNIFIVISNDLVDGGMSQSLIRNANSDQRDYSTVFFTNLFFSILLYGLIYLISPLVSNFYDNPILSDVLKVYALCIIIQSLLTIQRTKLTKEMKFKTQALISIPSTIIGGILGIWMAYNGYNVWSLVYMSIAKLAVEVIIFNIVVKWKPSLYFNKKRWLYHFNYGYKLTLAGMLNNLFQNLHTVVIAKTSTPIILGLYERSYQMRAILLQNLTSSLNKVTFPMFAQVKNDIVALKKMYKNLMIGVFIFTTMLLCGLFLNAKELIFVLFGEEWMGAVPIFKILCVSGLFFPLHSYNLNILKLKGKSNLFLKLEIYKKIVTGLNLLVGIIWGFMPMLYMSIFVTIINYFINSKYAGKEINYSTWYQLKDLLPILLAGIIATALSLLLKSVYLDELISSPLANMCVISIGFFIIYSISTYLFNKQIIFNLIKTFKR